MIVRAALLDGSGKEVKSPGLLSLSEGRTKAPFSCEGLKPGLYYLKISSGGQHSLKKLIITPDK
jgi:hypothetical protein